jgi:SAM-dependent methyltransferase
LTSPTPVLGGVARYYAGKLAEHGQTAAGVDWNSVQSQRLRFAQLMRVAEGEEQLTINDWGCGYGALVDFLDDNGQRFDYCGYDVAEEMVSAADERFRDRSFRFTTDRNDVPVADYTVASGIFNVRLDVGDETWLAHLLRTLAEMRAVSRKGFSFNMLTSYSDPERMRPDLYYADPGVILDHCIRHFSRRVAVLHDYELYEFTTIVRLDPSDEPG